MNNAKLFLMMLVLLLGIHTRTRGQNISSNLIKGDSLEVVGAKPIEGIDGMGYLDLGQWQPEKEYSFTLRRPKGAGANYAVSVWYQVVDIGLYTLDRDNRYADNFYSRPLSTPQYEWDTYQWDGWNSIVFAPGETEKTPRGADCVKTWADTSVSATPTARASTTTCCSCGCTTRRPRPSTRGSTTARHWPGRAWDRYSADLQ